VVAKCPDGVAGGCPGFSASATNHGLDGVVILRHDLSDGVVYSLYGHMTGGSVSTFTPEPGQGVSAGQRLGQTNGRNHVHFEVKSAPVLHNPIESPNSCIDPGSKSYSARCWGYVITPPDQSGYSDPLLFLHATSPLAETRVRVTGAGGGINMRVGPSGYRGIGDTVAGEEFAAFRTGEPTASPACSLGWYQIRRTDNNYFDDQNPGYGPMSLPDAWVCRGNGGEIWVESVEASQTRSQTDATGVDELPRGNPTQTLGSDFSGSFSSLAVKYEGACLPNSQHFYSLILMEFPDATYSLGAMSKFAFSVTHKVSSGCGTQTDVWTASDFSSTFTLDPSKFYAFLLYQLDGRPRGAEQDLYARGCYDTNQFSMPSISCQQPTNLKDLYFVLTFNPPSSPPTVSSVRPTSAAPGAKVIINGSGFGVVRGSGSVSFGAAGADISSWSNTRIIAFAPAGLQGTVPVAVTTPLGTSNGVDFTYYPSPAECGSVVSQQSGVDFCGEGLDVPSDCGSYGGGTTQLHKFAQVFTSRVTASPGKLALKIGGFFGSPSRTVNFKARIYDADDPNAADGGNLVATSDDLNVSTGAQGQNILVNFSGAAPQLLQNHTYTWIVEVTSGNIGDNGLKGSNDDGNNPGGSAYVWNQSVFQPGSNPYIPKYFYFALCGRPATADLSITKTASVNPAEVGRIFTYDITVSNAGPGAAQTVTVTDTLPAGVTFTSATPSQGSCALSSGALTCQLGPLAANGSASVALQVKPRQTGALENTASVNAAEPDPDASNNSATSAVTVIKTADLKVAKSDSADPVFVGEQVTYTMLVTNLGPLNGATGVTLIDSLPSGMTFVSATTTQGSLVTPPAGSAGLVTANLGELAAGAQATVTVTVTATQAGSPVNAATVLGNESDSNTANNTATQTTTVKGLALQKVLLAKQVLTGGCENTTGNVYLTGRAPAGGVTVALSSNVSGASAPPSVFVPAGQSVSLPFTVTTSPVSGKQFGLVTATLGASGVSRNVTVNVGNGSCP
jgi:uncharacterized repeat protein (TIGR01451 family)